MVQRWEVWMLNMASVQPNLVSCLVSVATVIQLAGLVCLTCPKLMLHASDSAILKMMVAKGT